MLLGRKAGLKKKGGGGLMRERGKWREAAAAEVGELAKGGAGMPVNSCTMARKLEVSVVRTVVGARLEARERFLDGLVVVVVVVVGPDDAAGAVVAATWAVG